MLEPVSTTGPFPESGKVNSTEDSDLVLLLKHPDKRREGFTLLVRRYQHKVYGVIRKMVIGHDDADDVVQEVFLKIWQNIDQFKGNSTLFTWVYRIATNECLMFLRKKRKQAWLGNDITETLVNQLMSEKHLDGDEIQLKLQKAILQLPDKQRLVFQLRYYDELTYEQMSEITHTSIGGLKASYHHATQKIEQFLQND